MNFNDRVSIELGDNGVAQVRFDGSGGFEQIMEAYRESGFPQPLLWLMLPATAALLKGVPLAECEEMEGFGLAVLVDDGQPGVGAGATGSVFGGPSVGFGEPAGPEPDVGDVAVGE